MDKDVRQAVLSTVQQLFAKHSETAASTPEQIAEQEAENYRLEVLAEF